MRGLLVFALIATACGGHPHLTLNAPPPNLSPDERVQAFQQLRPVGKGVEVTTTCNRGCSSTSTELLMLNGGHEVRYAEDLLPVLPPDSAAAAAAREVDTARRKSKRWGRIGYGLFGGGFVTMIIGFKVGDPVMYAGTVAMVVGIVGYAVGAYSYDREIKEKTRLVFDQYDQSLAARFNVCVNGMAVVACESSTPGTTPVEPDPALRSLRQK